MVGFNKYKEMIERVALALGEDLLQQVAFVGGCTTGLFLTDEFTLEQVRYTDDVDLIVPIVSHIEWAKLQESLRSKGFSEDMSEDAVICRMVLGELKVDFMPDTDVLGFSNVWYPEALRTAEVYRLSEQISIRLIQPVYFIATKLVAYQDRGDNDPMGSRDIEDILNLFDGRPSIIEELKQADEKLKHYVSGRIVELLKNNEFEYAVQSAVLGDDSRERELFQRLEEAVEIGSR
jgi:predicted nucleotidyltransferase